MDLTGMNCTYERICDVCGKPTFYGYKKLKNPSMPADDPANYTEVTLCPEHLADSLCRSIKNYLFNKHKVTEINDNAIRELNDSRILETDIPIGAKFRIDSSVNLQDLVIQKIAPQDFFCVTARPVEDSETAYFVFQRNDIAKAEQSYKVFDARTYYDLFEQIKRCFVAALQVPTQKKGE